VSLTLDDEYCDIRGALRILYFIHHGSAAPTGDRTRSVLQLPLHLTYHSSVSISQSSLSASHSSVAECF
jgi:hypothetical protein